MYPINFSVLRNHNLIRKAPRRTIFAQAGLGRELVIVLTGEVGLYAGYHNRNAKHVATVGPGEFFGESAFGSGRPMELTPVALTETIVLPVSRDALPGFVAAEPELTRELIQALCTRLEDALPQPLVAAPAVSASPAEAPAAPVAQQSSPPAAVSKPAPAPIPAPATTPAVPGAPFPLFPEGHGSYELDLKADDRTYLMERGYACPICKKEFRALQVRSSRLVEEGTDNDMRHRYRGIEPLYYDVVTCPHCLFSALSDQFKAPDMLKAELPEEVLSARAQAQGAGWFAPTPDTTSVFAGYYLALLCAPRFFVNHRLSTAKLQLKLSRIYQDCGDEAMSLQATKGALEAYLYLYINEQGDPGQDQQLCVVIGELYLRQGDLKNARDFFFKAKTTRGGSPLLKNHAESRIMDLRGNGEE